MKAEAFPVCKLPPLVRGEQAWAFPVGKPGCGEQAVAFPVCELPSVVESKLQLYLYASYTCSREKVPNQKNIYGAALALIAIMYGIMQGIIAVASLLATLALYGNGRDPQ